MLWEEHISVLMCGYTCNVLFDLMRCFPLQCAATGKVVKLSEPAEEVATFYARMLDHDYTTKDVFNNNFTKDWKKVLFTCSFCDTVEFVSKLSYVWKLSTTKYKLVLIFIDDDDVRERTNQRPEEMQFQRNGRIFQAQVRGKKKPL